MAGFAGGFFVGQTREPIPAPRAAAATPQAETYTDAAVADAVQEKPVEESPLPEVAQGASPEVARGADRPLPAPTSVPGSLLIASRPAGAEVFVDDRRVGVTPLSVPGVSAGQHRVRLERPGFRRWATSVNVDTGARVRVGASLTKG